MSDQRRFRSGVMAAVSPLRGRTTHNEISLASVDESLYNVERRVMSLESFKKDAEKVHTEIAVLKAEVASLQSSRNWWRSAVPVSIAMGILGVLMQLKNCT